MNSAFSLLLCIIISGCDVGLTSLYSKRLAVVSLGLHDKVEKNTNCVEYARSGPKYLPIKIWNSPIEQMLLVVDLSAYFSID